jgi:hypothetical protein
MLLSQALKASRQWSTRPSDRDIFERGSSFMKQKVKSLECGLYMSRGKKLSRSISKGRTPSNIRYRFSE